MSGYCGECGGGIKWTREVPTEPGWYWVRTHSKARPATEIMELLKDEKGAFFEREAEDDYYINRFWDVLKAERSEYPLEVPR